MRCRSEKRRGGSRERSRPTIRIPRMRRGNVRSSDETNERILAHRSYGHRPGESDIGSSGAQRPKVGGKAVASRRRWGQPRTPNLAATRRRFFRPSAGEGLEQEILETRRF